MTSLNQYNKALYAALSIVSHVSKPAPTIPACRAALGDALIAAPADTLTPTLCSLVDTVLEAEKASKPVVSATALPGATFIQPDMAIWRGDITSLKIDAIVNAANDAGLGCFQPSHRCIDNVIHRAAGPRLRCECKAEMKLRGHPLSAGSAPLLTAGGALPCKKVIHVTGPCIPHGSLPTAEQTNQLRNCYTGVLAAAAAANCRSVAFCCIGTGLFNFPSDQAAAIAVAAVQEWLKSNPGKIDLVVFDVFTQHDLAAYESHATLNTAASWIKAADAVLLVAGAGMSGYPEATLRNVYVDPASFRTQYPDMAKRGYKTAYETMGLMGDERVSEEVKWGYWARHYANLRFLWEPNDGYKALKKMVEGKEHFVLTSNVDGCFERAGFDRAKVYTPQGDCRFMQCIRACRPDAVFEAEDELTRIRKGEGSCPACKHCGGRMFMNLRAGSTFLHKEYDSGNAAFEAWVANVLTTKQKLVVIEVGSGFNTPTVTRFPAEAIVRDAGENGAFIRVNPGQGLEGEAPGGLQRAVSLKEGWQVLDKIEEAMGGAGEGWREKSGGGEDITQSFMNHFGHWSWKVFIRNLK